MCMVRWYTTSWHNTTKQLPNQKKGWKRWYFVYHEPKCANIEISPDREPTMGKWFNPRRSSGTIDP